ncbi:uncharacterized protein TEOVI_000604000 [Trypanosoma equiperdum]|uniref:Uncharacterized protein n=3 Tax=Trypanozoon TaxID=39700 RepID=Q57YW1_TRYB2|nr:hypothetical protein, conserved [Trypanosoma brucei brucei TREU927]AAX79671.1 hypothetical protein, conserved [Trypanosoma brucei]AAZ13117.1 hypothetical protein, conserved [Trypanosoma brucei brucei TREU927]SCU64491.1 hypothetical protein, conserved [Trypanosoma equiperdum]
MNFSGGNKEGLDKQSYTSVPPGTREEEIQNSGNLAVKQPTVPTLSSATASPANTAAGELNDPRPHNTVASSGAAGSVGHLQVERKQECDDQQPMKSPTPLEETLNTVTQYLVQRDDLPTIPLLQQQALLLGEVPDLKEVPEPSQTVFTPPKEYGDETGPWGSFLSLKKATGETVFGMMSFYDQVMKLQVTHEKEAASYREAAEHTVSQQRQTIEALTSECRILRSRNDRMRTIIDKTNQQLKQWESENSELNKKLREVEQRCAHVEDRAVVAECGRKMLELRLREVEMSLNYSTDAVNKLRKSLNEANRDRDHALQEQYNVYEANRRDMIEFYDRRERELVHEFNETVTKLQDIMYNAMKAHEDKLRECWNDMQRLQQEKHEESIKELNILREKEERDYNARISRVEQDNQRRYEQYRSEMALLEQRQREREEHLLMDISQRERELSEREQRLRVQRTQDEQDTKIALMAKETEVKTYYERLMENMRSAFDKEREKMCTFFREQVQEISQLHLENERQLERTHRDKEREMAQRYRIAGYEAEDRRGNVELRDVSMATQSALLSKFDAIEARQRERAEKARAVFQNQPESK